MFRQAGVVGVQKVRAAGQQHAANDTPHSPPLPNLNMWQASYINIVHRGAVNAALKAVFALRRLFAPCSMLSAGACCLMLIYACYCLPCLLLLLHIQVVAWCCTPKSLLMFMR